jgi:hypothetical protein
MIPSHLRFAAGVCVLAASLLMSAPGAAVSFAKPPSSDSTAQSDGGTNASDPQPSTGGKKAKKAKKTSGGTAATRGEPDSSQQPSTGTTTQTNAPGGTDATDKTTDSGTGTTTSGTGATTSGTGATTSGTGATPVIASSTSEAGAAAPNVEPAMTVPDVVTPVPTLVASVSDGIAWAQDMLTLVFGTVVPLTQLQSDLYSFLMGIDGAAPVVEVGGFAGAGLSAAGVASVASQWPLMPPLAAIHGVPVAGNAAGVAQLGAMAPFPFGAIQIGRNASLPGMAPLVPNDAIPMGEEVFGYARNELLPPASPSALAAGALSGAAGLAILTAAGVLPLSLAALARIALPGAGGLITLTAAGVRIGYRQAKASFAFRAAGIAGFARPGPLGVVRSGSSVVVRPRAATRGHRGPASRAGCPFDEAA